MSTQAREPKPAASRATRLTILCRGATAANQRPRFSSGDPLLAKEHARLSQLARGLRRFDLQYTVIAGGTCLTRSSYESCKFDYNSLTDPFWRPGMLAAGDVISLAILGGVNYGAFYDYSIYGHFNYQLNFP